MKFSNDLEQCIKVLLNGGVILYPTDTVWGLGCDATNAAAVNKIYKIKKRVDNKSMIVLMAEERDIIKYVAQPDLNVFDYLQETEKPTTVIYDGAIGMASKLIADDGSIAIRLVKDEFCRHLIKRLRKPLVSTSANISGEPAPPNFKKIDPAIISAVDYVVEYRQDDEVPREPSSLIKWNDDGTFTVLRK